MFRVRTGQGMNPPTRSAPFRQNCPAEVKFVMEINTAIQTGSPPSLAIMPKVNETDRYPRQMGSRPSALLKNSIVRAKRSTPNLKSFSVFHYSGFQNRTQQKAMPTEK